MLPEAVAVTGAGRGIGKAIALSLGSSGIPVLCMSKTSTCLKTQELISVNGGTAAALQVDLADFEATKKGVSRWIDGHDYRRVGMVLAAGVLGPSGPLEKTSLADWAQVFAVNVLGNLAVIQALSATMKENSFGRIVLFSGGGAAGARPHFPVYACTKTALVRIVENLHEDFKALQDFSVVCLAPGPVDTDMFAEQQAAGEVAPTPRTPDDAVDFISAFLNSQHANVLSGCFVHARDNWQPILAGMSRLEDDIWKLRRTTATAGSLA